MKKAVNIILLVMMISMPVAWMGIKYPYHTQSMIDLVSQHGFILMFFRWTIILFLFLSYRPIVRWAGKKQHWDIEKIAFWCDQRLKLTVWMVLFELVVVGNLPSIFVQKLEVLL